MYIYIIYIYTHINRKILVSDLTKPGKRWRLSPEALAQTLLDLSAKDLEGGEFGMILWLYRGIDGNSGYS